MGKRKVFVEIEMGELVPQMKATEEQMRTGKRVILNGYRIEQVITPEQLEQNYAELESQYGQSAPGHTHSGGN